MIVHPAVVITEESVKTNISASLVIVMEQDIQETDVKQVTTIIVCGDYRMYQNFRGWLWRGFA